MARISAGVSPGFDEEIIHQMRTTVKKMRAISSWAGIRKLLNKKYLVNLYKTAGKIRDAQLLLKGIAVNDADTKPFPVPSFVSWLNTYLEELKREWQDMYDEEKIKKLVGQLRKEILASGDSNRKHRPNRKFIKEKNEGLVSFQNERPLGDEQIHEGRKTVKEIQFVNDWKMKHQQEDAGLIMSDDLKRISDQAGDFMDICSAIQLLEMYIASESNDENRNAAITLLNEWKAKKDEQRSRLFESMRK